LFYLLVKTTKRYFGSIKHAKIKQVLSFKQVSVTLSNFLNRKKQKTGKNRFQNLPAITALSLATETANSQICEDASDCRSGVLGSIYYALWLWLPVLDGCLVQQPAY